MVRAMVAIGGLAMAALVMSGCQKEVIAVRGDTISQQFAQLNKQGWSVGFSDPNNPYSKKRSTDDPNVRIIRGADFTNVKFNTNFQIDDPKIRAQIEAQNGQANQSPTQGGINIFGPTPTH